MEISVNLMRQLEQVEPELRMILYSILEEIERQSKERVTKEEFKELRLVVEELAQAQSRTESRMEELAQAQSRTESRVDTLSQRMEELAQAQSRTESRMEELAQAQAKTEAEMRKLAKGQRELQKQVGGLSDSVGYGIEDRLMSFIPDYARLEYGMEANEPERKNVLYPDGKYDEVNILLSGRINNENAYLIGECKAKPGKKDADRFAAMLNRLSTVLEGRFLPILIGYTFAPEMERYVAQNYPQIRLAKTYAVEMRARQKR